MCRYRVTTPPLLPPFVGCFVRAPSRRQSQPHKKSSFWIHWPPMNTGNFLFCAFIHKLALTHWVLSARLKGFFREHFLLFPRDTFLVFFCQFTHVGNQPNHTRLIFMLPGYQQFGNSAALDAPLVCFMQVKVLKCSTNVGFFLICADSNRFRFINLTRLSDDP